VRRPLRIDTSIEGGVPVEIRDNSLPGWIFKVDEVSAGVYKVVGRSPRGKTVHRTGTDPDLLIDQCKADAQARS
jgi:hypothetical protein